MMLVSYDEAVHTYIGLTLITISAVGALLVDRRGAPPWARHLWLVLALFLAYITVLPASSDEHVQHLREQQPWLAPVRLLLTLDWPATWLSDMSQPHILQHKLAGLCVALPALGEWWIRRPVPSRWAPYLQWLAPLSLGVLAVIFSIHRPTHAHGHGAPMDMAAMQAELIQHWVIAAAFATSGVALTLARIGPLQARIPPRSWYAFLALAGLGFLVFRI